MHKSKLIKLFRGLAKTELLEFGRYLKTPFFNRDANLVKLYDYIKKHYPEFESEKLGKSFFLKKMTGNDSTKDRRIHDWMSDLTKKLEDYLIIVEMRNKPLTRDFVLLDVMKDRQIDELFFRNIKSMRNRLNTAIERDMFYYFYKWRLKHEAYFHGNKSQKYKSERDIEGTMLDMDKFFCAVKLRYSSEMMNKEFMASHNHSIALLPEVLKEIQKPTYRENQLFKIYQLIIEIFYDEKNETYDKLERLIFDNLHLSQRDEKLTLLTFLMNHAARRVNQGHSQYRKKLFDAYVYRINNDLILEDGHISAARYLNIVYLATTLHQADWLGSFIQKNAKYLNNNIRENTSLLAEAYLHFAQKEYKKSLRILAQTGGSDLFYIYVRTLTIQCHYEINQDAEIVLLDCNNFNKYLNRNENLHESAKKSSKNFIKFVRLLIETPYKKELTKEKLTQKLDSIKEVNAGPWLMEKIQELKR